MNIVLSKENLAKDIAPYWRAIAGIFIPKGGGVEGAILGELAHGSSDIDYARALIEKVWSACYISDTEKMMKDLKAIVLPAIDRIKNGESCYPKKDDPCLKFNCFPCKTFRRSTFIQKEVGDFTFAPTLDKLSTNQREFFARMICRHWRTIATALDVNVRDITVPKHGLVSELEYSRMVVECACEKGRMLQEDAIAILKRQVSTDLVDRLFENPTEDLTEEVLAEYQYLFLTKKQEKLAQKIGKDWRIIAGIFDKTLVKTEEWVKTQSSKKTDIDCALYLVGLLIRLSNKDDVTDELEELIKDTLQEYRNPVSSPFKIQKTDPIVPLTIPTDKLSRLCNTMMLYGRNRLVCSIPTHWYEIACNLDIDPEDIKSSVPRYCAPIVLAGNLVERITKDSTQITYQKLKDALIKSGMKIVWVNLFEKDPCTIGDQAHVDPCAFGDQIRVDLTSDYETFVDNTRPRLSFDTESQTDGITFHIAPQHRFVLPSRPNVPQKTIGNVQEYIHFDTIQSNPNRW